MATREMILTADPQSIGITDMGLRIQSDGSIFKWAEADTKPTTAQRHVCNKDRDVSINGPRKIWVWAGGNGLELTRFFMNYINLTAEYLYCYYIRY